MILLKQGTKLPIALIRSIYNLKRLMLIEIGIRGLIQKEKLHESFQRITGI